MKGFKLTVLSIWSWFVFGALMGLWIPLMLAVRLVTLPFDRARYWTGYTYRKLPVVHQKLNPLWHFTVSGTMPANPRNPYVVVSNHESFVDILLISHLPWEMKWLSKAELFKVPVAGWLMRLAGDVPVVRGKGDGALQAMQQCRERLDKKVSVMIFPEGTRSTTGEFLPFKDGAFRLAIAAGVPVLPLAVIGTSTALRKHDWRIGESHAEVRVLRPVPTTGLTIDDIPVLRDRVRDLIQAEVNAMRAERAALA